MKRKRNVNREQNNNNNGGSNADNNYVEGDNSSSSSKTIIVKSGGSNRYVTSTVQSKSLYNFSGAPGWSEQENRILRYGIMKFGVGSWSTIKRAGILPGKNFAQLYIQTQRMLGVQSLAQFNDIKLDVDQVRKDYELLAEKINETRKKGEKPQYCIKNGLIVNNGANPTKESTKQKKEQNKKKYQLSDSEIKELVDEVEMYALKRKKRLEFTKQLTEYLKCSTNNGIYNSNDNVSIEEVEEELEESKQRLHLLITTYISKYKN
ncbi:hypothetical protein ABK040_008690 [Willaertia magna]